MEQDQYGWWGRRWHGDPIHQGWRGFQAKRGDIGPILLGVLAEKPMHGYEIIRELENKSHGMWRPSPGSVYPTLQLLEEQDFVTSHEDGGKKIYTITEAGRAEAKQRQDNAPWEWNKDKVGKVVKLKVSLGETSNMFWQILHSGSDAKMDQATAVLDEAKAKLQRIIDAKETKEDEASE